MSTEATFLENLFSFSDLGGELSIRDLHKDTLSHVAASHGFPKAAEFLVAFGSLDFNAKNSINNISLHSATTTKQCTMIRLLGGFGANLNAANIRGDTAVHEPMIAGDHQVLKVLVECGADIDVVGHLGPIPLEMAALWAQLDIYGFLVKEKAKQGLRDQPSRLPEFLTRSECL